MEWDFLFMENHHRIVLGDYGYHNYIYYMEDIKETCCEKSLKRWRNPLFLILFSRIRLVVIDVEL